jgi:hypothetical protein
MKRFLMTLVVMLVLMFFGSSVAFSDTITLTSQTFDSGVGFGAVTNLLSLQDLLPAGGGDTVEFGSITPTGGTSNEVKNTSNTYTSALLAGVGLSASSFGIIFNISEEGNNGTVILSSFSLDIYNGSGVLQGQIPVTICEPLNPLILGSPCGRIEFGGTGTAGYIMTVQLGGTNLLTSFFANPTWILGGSGNITNVDDGQENFYLVKIETGSPPTIVKTPEPSSLLLLGVGLLWAAKMRHKRKT